MGDIFNVMDSRKAGLDPGGVREVEECMQDKRRHDVDEETGDFVEGMEDEGVTPHCDGPGIIAIGQAVGGD